MQLQPSRRMRRSSKRKDGGYASSTFLARSGAAARCLTPHRKCRLETVLSASFTPLFQGWDTFLRRTLAEVQILSVALLEMFIRHHLG